MKHLKVNNWVNNSRIIVIALFLMIVLLAACGQNEPATPVAPPAGEATLAPPPGPTPDPNIPESVLPEPQPGQPSAIADYNTYIYGGPGTNYQVYGAFLGGKTATVVGRSDNGLWWAVDVPVASSKVGWVDAGWVTVQGAENVPVLPTPPVPPTTAIVPPGPDDPQAVALVNTYVRQGPGSNYPAYGIAPAGARAGVIGKTPDGQWLVVRLDPQVVGLGYGWVPLSFVQATNIEGVQVVDTNAPPDTVVPPAPDPGSATGTALENLNVRTGPGLNYPVLFVAPAGASSTITGRSADNEWWQVVISTDYATDGLAWVYQYYVTASNVEGVPVVDAPGAPSFPEEPPSSVTCALTAQNPEDYTVQAPNSQFQTSWTLQNLSQEAWDNNEIDVRYVLSRGSQLHLGSDLYDLEANVDVNESFTLTVPMVAPAQPGEYGELWGLYQGNNTFCEFWVIIEVE